MKQALFTDGSDVCTNFLECKIKTPLRRSVLASRLYIYIYFFYHGSLSHPLWFEVSVTVLLKAFSVWAVRGHDAVEAGPSWLEALLFRLVLAFDQTHELAHAVT